MRQRARTSPPIRQRRVDRVLDQVDQRLLDLVGVIGEQIQRRPSFTSTPDALLEPRDALHEFVDLDIALVRRRQPRERRVARP